MSATDPAGESKPISALDKPIDLGEQWPTYAIFVTPAAGAFAGFVLGPTNMSRHDGTQALAFAMILMALAYWFAHRVVPRTVSVGFLAFVLTLGAAWCAFQFGASLKPTPPTGYYR